MNNVLTQEACMEKIEELRSKMVNAARQYGMTHPLVLRYSQELDCAHNIMMMLDISKSSVWESSLQS